jgi:hypothetical protein
MVGSEVSSDDEAASVGANQGNNNNNDDKQAPFEQGNATSNTGDST